MVVAAHKWFYYDIANKIIILSLTKQTSSLCRDFDLYCLKNIINQQASVSLAITDSSTCAGPPEQH